MSLGIWKKLKLLRDTEQKVPQEGLLNRVGVLKLHLLISRKKISDFAKSICWIMFIFDRCPCSWAAGTHVRYEHDMLHLIWKIRENDEWKKLVK